MKNLFSKILTGLAGLGCVAFVAACAGGSGSPQLVPQLAGTQATDPSGSTAGTMFEKYGGQATVQKIVDDATTAIVADPVTAPYFSNLGQPGHDSLDRLKSCLDLQLTSLLGGPGAYPGVSHFRSAPSSGYQCQDMRSSHDGLNITTEAFDHFMTSLTTAMRTNGVTDADIAIIEPKLRGTSTDIVGGRVNTPTGDDGKGQNQGQNQNQNQNQQQNQKQGADQKQGNDQVKQPDQNSQGQGDKNQGQNQDKNQGQKQGKDQGKDQGQNQDKNQGQGQDQINQGK